jgi:hypothetical protein
MAEPQFSVISSKFSVLSKNNKTKFGRNAFLVLLEFADEYRLPVREQKGESANKTRRTSICSALENNSEFRIGQMGV